MNTSQNSINILNKLIAFDTTSYKSNLDLIRYVAELLRQFGIKSELVYDRSQNKANLFASVGPSDQSGIILSGHTDVVPVEGQEWLTEPFKAIESGNNIYGRGTADMKGFIACAISAMIKATEIQLNTPLHLCLSYDEEIGCIGVHRILEILQHKLVTPKLCLIGEPTMMQIATGHKGKAVYQAICRGQEGHSAYAPHYKNAIHYASNLIQSIRYVQQDIINKGRQDLDYEIPYSTLHIGKVSGGTALNIVPNECVVDFEVRHLACEPPTELINHLYTKLEQQNITNIEWIDIDQKYHYPGLDTPSTLDAVMFVQNLFSTNKEIKKIAFGTEGGLFNQYLQCPVLVCGPGSISVAHKPNEYVSIEQIKSCDEFLKRLISSLQ